MNSRIEKYAWMNGSLNEPTVSSAQMHICTSIFTFIYISPHIIPSEMVFHTLEVCFCTFGERVSKIQRLRSQSCLVLWWEAGYFGGLGYDGFIGKDLLHTRICFLLLSQSLLNWSLNSNKIIKIEHSIGHWINVLDPNSCLFSKAALCSPWSVFPQGTGSESTAV